MSDVNEKLTALAARISHDQKMTYRVTPQPGVMMTAQAVGGQLVALGDLLRSIAQEEDTRKWRTAVSRIVTNDDGSMEFDLIILPEIDDVKSSTVGQGAAP